MNSLVLSVSDFVAVFNQTLEYAYPGVTIVGELVNLRVSKNKWVYFDLKDELASVKFFGTVYNLSGPLEDGLMLQVSGQPRLHPQYGFSVNIESIQPVGEGSLKRAAVLLEAKLTTEGLFDPDRKRPLPYPPKRIGLITSAESAAYKDFVKILAGRWQGIDIQLADVQVQGDRALSQIISAIEHLNTYATPVEVIVITRGGGSAEDLAVFNTEQVTRAVAGSRIPTMLAIGHEVDVSLAEMAADIRASTPSNAAELLVPDRRHVSERIQSQKKAFKTVLGQYLVGLKSQINTQTNNLHTYWKHYWRDKRGVFQQQLRLLEALSPRMTLQRGYVILKFNGQTVRTIKQLKPNIGVNLQLYDGEAGANITSIKRENKS